MKFMNCKKREEKRSVGNRILLLFLGLCFSLAVLHAEDTKPVSGVVKDTKNESLIGVTIKVKNKQIMTVTNNDGQFVIAAGQGEVLELTYIGFKTKEVPVQGNNMNIVLEEDQVILDDIVVIGYGSMKAKESTSAIAHISSDKFSQISSTNPLMQIQGKVASVSISNTSEADPNSAASVQIRGVSSRNAGLGPLYVIDGVAGANIQNVNSNDIASIDILKDGAASAIYGTRGSNGVIIVTTKKGNTDGTISTSYSGYMAVDMIINKPDLLTADEFRTLRVPEGANDFGSSTDWFDQVTQTGKVQSHTLTISGGNSKMNYRATVDYRDAEGVDIRSGRKEYGARASLNHGQASDIFRMSLSVAPRVINRDMSDQSAIDIAIRANPTFYVMEEDNPSLYSTFTNRLPTGPNPVEKLKLIENGSETKILDWNASATLNILSAINPDLANGTNMLNTQVTLSQNIIDNFDYSFIPSTVSTNRDANIKGQASRGYSKAKMESLEWIANGAYTYQKHSFTGMVGYSYNYFENSGLSAGNRNFVSDALKYNNLGSGDNEALLDKGRVYMRSSKESSKLIGFFGRLTYNYANKYMMTASLRYEGSSRFGTNHKWGYFPAVSGGWRIKNEEFMRNVSWIDDLKLRADFGITGNQNIPNYKSLAQYSPSGQVFYNGDWLTITGPTTNINPNLHWEKGINWNVGVDFSIFNNILSGSLNYYNRTQKDLVGTYDAPMPPNVASTIFVNVGTMLNSGVEADLYINAITRKDFSYTIGLVGEINHNIFKKFSNDLYQSKGYDDSAKLGLGDFGVANVPIQRMEEGHRVGAFYMLSYAGLDNEGKWLVWNKDNTEKISINDAVDDDKRYVGNGLPKYRMSMSHMFKYKNWDLSLSFRGAFGFDIYNTMEYAFGISQGQKGYNIFHSAYEENKDIKDGMGKPTDYFLTKGDYMKLDVATLGYTLKIKNSRFLSSVRVYMTGRNLFTIKGYDGLDPDFIPVNGLTPGALTSTRYYPSTRQILGGLQLSF